MTFGTCGYVTRWRPEEGEGLLRLADGTPILFSREAFGDPARGGAFPSVGAHVRVVEFADPDRTRARIVNPVWPAHPMRAVIEAVPLDDHPGRASGIEFENARVDAELERAATEAADAKASARRARDHADATYARRLAANGWQSEADDPLLAAVLAEPEADEPRRRFAAQLLADGSEYGAFIDAQLDGAHRDVVIPRRWKAPAGLRDTVYERGFLARALLAPDADVNALAKDWRLGTLEWLDVETKHRKGDWLDAYRTVVTSSHARALRVIRVELADDVANCPAFGRGVLTGVLGLPWQRVEAPPTWATNVHVDATDTQWPRALDALQQATSLANRRVRVWNRGCSHADRRDHIVERWHELPVEMIAIWDIALVRNATGTIAQLAGWPSVGIEGLVWPGLQMLAKLTTCIRDLRAIETHGERPPGPDDTARLGASGIPWRHITRRIEGGEGVCYF